MSTNNERTHVKFDIVDGPSKDTIFDSCKYLGVRGVKIPIRFAVSEGLTLPQSDDRACYMLVPIRDLVVRGIKHEDGSSERFILEGSCHFSDMPDDVSSNYTAYYDTKIRKGWMMFLE